MEDYLEAVRVLFILDGDDDPVQEASLADVLIMNDFLIPVEPWDGVAR